MSEKKDRFGVMLLIAVAVTLVIVAGVGVLNYFWGLRFEVDGNVSPGTLGDMFGFAGAIYSGFAFTGLIVTLVMQRKELQYQREELQSTREEVRGQREAMEKQNEIRRTQQVEDTFFKMLSLHNEIVSHLEHTTYTKVPLQSIIQGRGPNYKTMENTVRGREAFSALCQKFLNAKHEIGLNENAKSMWEAVSRAYNQFDTPYKIQLEHYFRNLFQIVSLLASGTAFRYHASVLNAQLSDAEKKLILYRCVRDLKENENRFGRYVEATGLLQGLEPEMLPNGDYALLRPEAYELREYSFPN